MFALIAIIAFALLVFAALAVLGFVAHVLFSPWLLLVVAIALVAWMKLRPRRSHR